VTQKDISTGDGQSNDDNNAGILTVGYNSGPLNASAGYQYIDPRFSAPGYWNKIGNWYNPTNVRGPFVRVGYNFSHAVQGYLGGDFLEGARNRDALAVTSGPTLGWGIADNVTRASAGVKWNVTKMVNLRADYEGVFYDLAAGHSASGVESKPVEQYITLGAGLNLAQNTVLKLAYQMIGLRDVGSGFSFLPNPDGGGAIPGGVSNASVFTTQLAVHF
ncbi:MAG TPA: hypothetical protein VGS41_02185, partial [Chthonomonadales bacterium]|nr:hypothetical protein [Chthonomonadales bacterium]